VLAVVDRDGTTELLRQEIVGVMLENVLEWPCVTDGIFFMSVVGRGNVTGTFALAVRTQGVTINQAILVRPDAVPPPDTAVRRQGASVWFSLLAEAGETYEVESKVSVCEQDAFSGCEALISGGVKVCKVDYCETCPEAHSCDAACRLPCASGTDGGGGTGGTLSESVVALGLSYSDQQSGHPIGFVLKWKCGANDFNTMAPISCHGLTFACDKTGAYYISVTGIGNATGTFELTARTVGVTAPQAIAVEADGASPPDTLVRHPGAAVWFRVEAEVGMTYEVEVQEGTLSDPVLTVVDRDGTTELLRQEKVGHATGLTWACAVSGVYFASVVGRGNATGTFTLAVRTVGQTPTVKVDSTSQFKICAFGNECRQHVDHAAVSALFGLLAIEGVTIELEVDAGSLLHSTMKLIRGDAATELRQDGNPLPDWHCGVHGVKPPPPPSLREGAVMVQADRSVIQEEIVDGVDKWFAFHADMGSTYDIEVDFDTLHFSIVELFDTDQTTVLKQTKKENQNDGKLTHTLGHLL
jgi:hypothetical protein